MRPLSFLAVFVLLTSVLACSVEETDQGKGPESEMPVAGSADSWRNPTNHGELLFGVPSDAEFADDALYHAWDFSLTGPARAQLRVIPIADNMDTVMYLYRRDAGETNWGHYQERNDDFEGNMWSGLDVDLQQGEYRIMVKGYKQSLRGRFRVQVDCSGDGCGDLTGDCSEEIDGGPAATDFGKSCVADILDTHSVPVTTASFYVLQSERCEQPHVVRLAWDYYHTYWDSMVGWDSIVYDAEDEMSFEIDFIAFTGGGTQVDVDYGGDEMAMTYLFGKDQTLVAEYQHNQSPTFDFYCGDEGEPTFEWPNEDCFHRFLTCYPTAAPDAEVTGEAGFAEGVEPPALQAAFNLYAADLGHTVVPDQELVTYKYVRWPAYSTDEVFVITLQADGDDAIEYMIGWDSYDQYVFTSDRGGVVDFRCSDLGD